MKFLKNLLRLIVILAVLALVNRWYLGGFIKVEVKEQNMEQQTIAYVNFIGEYNKVWSSMDKVYMALSGVGIVSYTGVGIYYDDPAIVSWAKLRSDVGAVIDPQDARKLTNDPDIKTKTLPQGNKIVAEFPMKNTFSSMVGPIRVYPAIIKYMIEKWYSHEVVMVELYDMIAKKIYYIAEIVVK